MIKINDLNFIKNKKGVDGLLLQQVYKEQTQSFAYDAFMRLRHLRELDSHWVYNLADEVISMNAQSKVDNFVIAANIEESNFGQRKVDHHGEVHLFNQNQQIISRELVNRFGRAVKEDSQFMYQGFDYQKGLLTGISHSIQGQQYLERISYDQEKRPSLLQTPFVDLKLSYDQYGNISQVNAKSDSAQSEHSYRLRGDGRVEGIDNLIAKINYDGLGRVQNIQYSSGLSTSFDYRLNRLTSLLASKNGRELFGQTIRYNQAGLVEEVQTESQTVTQSSYQYDSWMRPQVSKSQIRANRNIQGEVLADNKRKFSYCQGSLCQIADDVQIYSDYKGEMKVVKINSRPYLYKVNDDTFWLQGKIIQAVRVHNKIIAVTIDGLSYPVLTDYRGSLIAMFSEEGELLWERSYSEWGEKKLSYALNLEAKKLEALIPWSFAHLIEIPSVSSADNLYWSKTRVYHAGLHEWMSIDPAFKFNPKLLLEHPGNWRPIEYATGDPLNFVDPSGNAAHVPAAIIIGGVVGGGLSAYASYMSGARGLDLARATTIGLTSGALSATGFGGILGSMAISGGSNLVSQFYQAKTLIDLNFMSLGISTIAGGFGASLGYYASKHLQLSTDIIGHSMQHLSSFMNYSNRVISTGISGMAGGLLDYGGHSLMNTYEYMNRENDFYEDRVWDPNNYSFGDFNFSSSNE